jgi:hypothetical protein
MGRSEHLQGMLAAARADTATPAQMQRVAVRLSTLAVLPAASAAKAATSPLAWSLAGKLGVVGAAVLTLVTAGAVLRPRPAPPVASARRHQPVVLPIEPPVVSPIERTPAEVERAPVDEPAAPPSIAPPPVTPRALPRPRPRRTSTVSRRAAVVASASPAPVDPTSVLPATERAPPEPTPAEAAPPPPASVEARRLLEARALVSSDPAGALELIALHEEQFPSSRLAQERELIAVDALIRRGRLGEARARLHAFRQHYPGSAHSRRLEALEAATER